MLKRIHVKGYKSLANVEVDLRPLSLLFGPNAAGKSNFFDALQILQKIVSTKTLKDAFGHSHRGRSLESFTFGKNGIGDLIKKKQVRFSIEVDLRLSDSVINQVDEQIRKFQYSGDSNRNKTGNSGILMRERHLRYRIEIEMLPRNGTLRVADEYLAALTKAGNPSRTRNAFIERKGEKICLRRAGQAHPTYYDRYLDHSILSMPHYPPHHPHLIAARRELERWLIFCFEPRERMRSVRSVQEAEHIGSMGEDLPVFLNTLKSQNPKQFDAIEKSIKVMIPSIDRIKVEVNEFGEVDLYLRDNGTYVSSRVISDGTLRILGLLALSGVENSFSLIGFEEPENSIDPSRIPIIAEFLNSRGSPKTNEYNTIQYIITTYSPALLDLISVESLFLIRRIEDVTHIESLSDCESNYTKTLISDRLLRGYFNK